jgi:hypothetical protein
MTEILCDWFRDMAPDLAFGTVESHGSRELLDHAAGCLSCQSYLDQLSLIGDRLLLAGPQVSPPAGFEERAVARMLPPAPVSTPGGRRRPPWRRIPRRMGYRVALVAAIIVALAGVSIAGGYAVDHDRGGRTQITTLADATRTGTIIRTDGTVAGTITLARQPRPLALITLDNPRAGSGVVTCELVAAGGQATTIGSWTFDQVARGAWAVGIDPALLSADRMDIRSPAGAVVASAALH